jgi:hypothetical protein
MTARRKTADFLRAGMVTKDGIELQGGIDNTQVVDIAFGQKG